MEPLGLRARVVGALARGLGGGTSLLRDGARLLGRDPMHLDLVAQLLEVGAQILRELPFPLVQLALRFSGGAHLLGDLPLLLGGLADALLVVRRFVRHGSLFRARGTTY